jgi:excisionase family DNA binding protein
MSRYDDDDDAGTRAERAKRASPFLNTAQAAWYLGLHFKTLAALCRRGEGPRVRRHGRFVRFHIADLDDWSLTHRKGGEDA